MKFFVKIQKQNWGVGSAGTGGQGRCEHRSEVFCENSKKNGEGRVRGSGGGGVRVDVNEELKFFRKLKKSLGVGVRLVGGGGGGGGVQSGCERNVGGRG